MKIYTAMISTPNNGGTNILKCDTIEFEGRFWLVPVWLEDDFGEIKTPKRIICMSVLDHQVLGPDSSYADFLVKEPIPKEVLYGEATEHNGIAYLIVECPELPDIPSGSLDVH